MKEKKWTEKRRNERHKCKSVFYIFNQIGTFNWWMQQCIRIFISRGWIFPSCLSCFFSLLCIGLMVRVLEFNFRFDLISKKKTISLCHVTPINLDIFNGITHKKTVALFLHLPHTPQHSNLFLRFSNFHLFVLRKTKTHLPFYNIQLSDRCDEREKKIGHFLSTPLFHYVNRRNCKHSDTLIVIYTFAAMENYIKCWFGNSVVGGRILTVSASIFVWEEKFIFVYLVLFNTILSQNWKKRVIKCADSLHKINQKKHKFMKYLHIHTHIHRQKRETYFVVCVHVCLSKIHCRYRHHRIHNEHTYIFLPNIFVLFWHLFFSRISETAHIYFSLTSFFLFLFSLLWFE